MPRHASRSIYEQYRVGASRPHRRRHPLVLLMGGMLLSGLVAVGVYVGAVALAALQAADQIFQPAVLPTEIARPASTAAPLPATPQPGEPPAAAPPAIPVATAAPEILPEWKGTDRINVLLLGVDRRPGDDVPRSDTMILVSIDPAGRRVGMISIPRDLRVTIPGIGVDKINAAYPTGEGLRPNGGGAALAMQTVRDNFRVPIHHYATVDFRGFMKIVDAVGGISVEVPYPLKDDEYPSDEGFHYTRLYVAAGLQHMDGQMALRYARSRHFDSDFGRQRRQQQVLRAIREQGLKLNLLPRVPEFINLLKDSVRTDMPVGDLPGLARLGMGIKGEDIKSYGLTQEMTIVHDTPEAFYLDPDWRKINAAFREMLGGVSPSAGTPTAAEVIPTPTTPLRPKATATTAPRSTAPASRPAATGTAPARGTASPAPAARTPAAGTATAATPTVPVQSLRVAVRNGTMVDGLAARNAEALRGRGYTVVDISQDPKAGEYPRSIVYTYGASTAQAQAVAQALGLPAGAVKLGPAPAPAGTDILVILGEDAQR